MSADNGIYILETQGTDGPDSREYRVGCHQAIDNIEFKPNYPRSNPRLNKGMVLEYFGHCEVFTNEKRATNYALEVKRGCEYLEYGISSLDFGDVPFPRVTWVWWIFRRLRNRLGNLSEDFRIARWRFRNRFSR